MFDEAGIDTGWKAREPRQAHPFGQAGTLHPPLTLGRCGSIPAARRIVPRRAALSRSRRPTWRGGLADPRGAAPSPVSTSRTCTVRPGIEPEASKPARAATRAIRPHRIPLAFRPKFYIGATTANIAMMPSSRACVNASFADHPPMSGECVQPDTQEFEAECPTRPHVGVRHRGHVLDAV